MERAARLIARWKTAGGDIPPADLATAAWRVAAGDKIAARTVAVDLVRTHMIVRVEDDIWRRQLLALRGQILRNLTRILGAGIVEDIELRVAPRRIGPGREGFRSLAPAAGDEADGIGDPVLKAIYKSARKKASA